MRPFGGQLIGIVSPDRGRAHLAALVPGPRRPATLQIAQAIPCRDREVDGQVAAGTTLSRGYREGGVSIDAALVQAGAVIDVAVG